MVAAPLPIVISKRPTFIVNLYVLLVKIHRQHAALPEDMPTFSIHCPGHMDDDETVFTQADVDVILSLADLESRLEQHSEWSQENFPEHDLYTVHRTLLRHGRLEEAKQASQGDEIEMPAGLSERELEKVQLWSNILERRITQCSSVCAKQVVPFLLGYDLQRHRFLYYWTLRPAEGRPVLQVAMDYGRLFDHLFSITQTKLTAEIMCNIDFIEAIPKQSARGERPAHSEHRHGQGSLRAQIGTASHSRVAQIHCQISRYVHLLHQVSAFAERHHSLDGFPLNTSLLDKQIKGRISELNEELQAVHAADEHAIQLWSEHQRGDTAGASTSARGGSSGDDCEGELGIARQTVGVGSHMATLPPKHLVAKQVDRVLVESCTREAPEEFLDPITHEVMEKPVITAHGNTYEHSSIAKWLEGHDTDPLTNVVLPHKDLTPNNVLRSMILRFRESSN